MDHNIYKRLQEAGGDDMQMQIAFHCAPLIAGLKLSNLLVVRSGETDRIKNILKRTGIFYFTAAVMKERTAVLLFDREQLENYIRKESVWQVFQQMGYQEQALGRVLSLFRLRYEEYLTGKRNFPHEMGLLLGYPVEDVKGYINHEGKNCLYAGYWKVYENPSEKMALFGEFERARELLLRFLSDGLGIVEIIQWRFQPPYVILDS